MKNLLNKITLRKVLIFIGFGGFVFFLAPAVFSITFNLGNATGGAICLILALYGIFKEKIDNFIKNLWEKKIGKVLISFILCLFGAVIVLIAVETGFMIKGAVNKPKENSTLIVLGCRVYGERPSRMLCERLQSAYKYLDENEDAYCIVSGGQGEDEGISEAECMYRYLVAKGISKDRIFKEDKSTSTRENMQFSKKIMEDNNLNSENVAIATSEFHEYRACRIANGVGLKNCTAVPGHSAIWHFPTYYLRELYGILYEWIF
jgi:uncharacterized SAM-binding protein YcdF (DUF218 family)